MPFTIVNNTIHNKQLVGRYIKPSTGRPVNVYTGTETKSKKEITFYWFQGKPIKIKNLKMWKKTAI